MTTTLALEKTVASRVDTITQLELRIKARDQASHALQRTREGKNQSLQQLQQRYVDSDKALAVAQATMASINRP